jgi:hypothetical protein
MPVVGDAIRLLQALDDPLAALSWYASHLFGARRTHRLETLARIFQRDS